MLKVHYKLSVATVASSFRAERLRGNGKSATIEGSYRGKIVRVGRANAAR